MAHEVWDNIAVEVGEGHGVPMNVCQSRYSPERVVSVVDERLDDLGVDARDGMVPTTFISWRWTATVTA